MRFLSGKESHTTGKFLLYKGSVHASDRTKASAFVEEYAKISVRKSDKGSRKAVMVLRCPTRSTRTTPWQQIEVAFTPVEHQLALSQLKAGKTAGPNGIAPDLQKHMSTTESSVLLIILNSGVRGPVPLKGEGHIRLENLPPNSANFDNKEGHGKTHCQSPVMVASGTLGSNSLAGRFQ